MRNYEFTFIIAPTVEDDNIQAVVDKVSAWIESIDGQVTTVDHWGRRELAYQIQDFGEGSYVFMETRLEPNTLNELERNLKLDLDIIRYLLVRVEE
ncbi:MAG: 30S ribosomal protein S6 [Anaerolineaceae bacterium 4572_32.1]|nr:MAG: 30S ribosomal protein S6 [Anaerolineaceae bacterium 4572_32.1]